MPPRKAIRSDGRYRVSVSIGIDENGKRRQKYFYGKTQCEEKGLFKVDRAGHSA